MLQIFARLLDGKTAVFRFSTENVSGYQIKERVSEITGIPPQSQRLIHSGLQLQNESVVSDRDSTVHLTLRLPGGKGGFGSLLRGAATKAGQKKTNNFGACRDMNGRRLRHVNAEKRLEEWRAEEEERKLEKLAEDFLKKEAKKRGGNKSSAADREAEKYVQSYREQSAKCVNEVEEAMKEACGMALKRKEKDPIDVSQNKRVKIWSGKRNSAESESDYSTDEENDDERSKKSSTITSSATISDSKVEAEQSSDSVTGGKPDVKEPEVAVEKNSDTAEDLESKPHVSELDADQEKPLNFEEFTSAADLEVLGLERLKFHLQKCGLKCGGTVEERAARLFLLKTTPLEKLPKKMFAKK